MRLLRGSWLGRLLNRRDFSDLWVHETMLADTVRNAAYREAIARHVAPGQVVVDLGAGTGILSFMAAMRGAATVYAVEHGGILELARAVAEANHLRNVVFVDRHSRRFRPREAVDVIVQELMSPDLFSENMLASVLDLRDRVLRPGGRILPNRFEVYLEPVQLHDDHRLPFLWEHELDGIRYQAVRGRLRGGMGRLHPLVSVEPRQIARHLGDPRPAFSFDLETMDADQLPRRLSSSRTVLQPSRLDGYCFYFTAWFDEEISFSTLPSGGRTSWPLPLHRTEARACRPGDRLEAEVLMDPIAAPSAWRWRIREPRG
jgi:protein arginine N-methyltransferase 1